ncbi:MAG: hypothetical protein ABW187_02750 [Dokdonella sp.]
MLPLSVAAEQANLTETTNAGTREKLAQVAQQVHGEMHGGGRFEFVKPAERRTIDAKFAEMDALFARSGSVDAMSADAKIALFNAQETINSILTDRDGDRLICKRAPLIDSHIPRQTCQTYRDQMAKTEVSQKQLLDWQTTVCKGGALCPSESGSGQAPGMGGVR